MTNWLKQISTPPESVYTRKNDIYKFGLAWKIFVYLSFFFFVISAFHFANHNRNAYTTLLAAIMSVAILYSLKKTGKYTISVFIVMILGSAINQYTIYTALNVERAVDLLWMISNATYIFYMLGAGWGLLSLGLNMLGLIGAMFIVPNEEVVRTMLNKNFEQKVAHAINILVASGISGYFIKKIIDFSIENENQYKQANKDLKKQRDEKIIMLQEIHHRVKNNLQIVSSLLRLQSSQFDNKEMLLQFQEATNRVSSMALIHEKMYMTEDLSNVDIKNYLNSLFSDISRSYTVRCNIRYHIESNVENFHLDSLVPLALIFNELITNSIKHAFTDMESGEISIIIDKKHDNVTHITYKDNGKGMNEEVDTENFGSILIETFTDQLEGTYSIQNNNGTEYHFEFNDLK